MCPSNIMRAFFTTVGDVVEDENDDDPYHHYHCHHHCPSNSKNNNYYFLLKVDLKIFQAYFRRLYSNEQCHPPPLNPVIWLALFNSPTLRTIERDMIEMVVGQSSHTYGKQRFSWIVASAFPQQRAPYNSSSLLILASSILNFGPSIYYLESLL